MRSVYFVSLGCDKNLVDSEHMLGDLARKGYRVCDDPAEAEVIVVNTCSFILDASEESVNTILEMAEIKKEGTCRVLVVTGCMAQRYAAEIRESVPEVDAVLGTNSYDSLADAIEQVYDGEHPVIVKDLTGIPAHTGGRLMTTGGHYEYLKIAEGCSKHCSYCIIPSLRGSYRSVPMEELLEEARRMVEDGVRELNLVAQETTVYGVDLYGEKRLHVLLQELAKIPDLRWIRILYCYPEEIYPELIETMKQEPKVCHYLDMPIQHCNDDILRRMGRKTTKADLLAIIARLRKEIPDIALRTTLIAGFPGETEAQHQELLDFVRQCCFERLGAFAYSREEGTPAASFEGQLEDAVKEARRDALMEAQHDLAEKNGRKQIGRVLPAFVEGRLTEDDSCVCRTYMDAPDVDGYLFVDTEKDHISGDFITCRITGAYEYDLTGVEIDESAE